jgi:glucosamine--fructose-6-phosphate aminotransferase (isomerizing)
VVLSSFNPVSSVFSQGISHTRWATHGKPSDENSHPHYSEDMTVAVVHNGIIENYATLKSSLQSE